MGLPVYSIVVPLYDTARYLPALLDSLARQDGLGSAFSLECVFVDDSSPDDAGALAQKWLTRTGIDGQVIDQPQAGVSAARNNGLDHVTGQWVAFIDSDDFLSGGYVLGVHRFLEKIGSDVDSVSLVSCNVARYFETDDRYDHAHPLRDKFNRGDRLYPLDEHPQFIQSQAASAFFPVARLRASGVRFLEGLHASEDALFVASYLLSEQRPVIACVAGSDYYYRQRASADSAVNTFVRNPDYYFARFSRGYVPLLARAKKEKGSIPRWVGQHLLYEMRWFLPREQKAGTKATHLSEPQKAEVLELVASTLRQLEASWVRDYSITGMDLELRDLLLGLMGEPLLSAGIVQVGRIDEPRNLVQLRYRFAGDLPDEKFTVAGRAAEVIATKTRRLDYFGQRVVRERIVWVQAEDDLAVKLGGREQQLVVEQPPHPAFTATRARMGFDRYQDPVGPLPHAQTDRPLARRIVGRARREFAALAPGLVRDARLHSLGKELRGRRVSELVMVHGQRPAVRARLHHAWLFFEGIGSAQDDIEAIYRHVRMSSPEINAYFVVGRDSSRRRALRHSGAQLIDYGSVEHRAALLHADLLISTRVDVNVAAPIPQETYWDARIPWRFVYLQHGTLREQDALLLGQQPLALFAATTQGEKEALTADDTTTLLTELEVVFTGSPSTDDAAAGRVLRAIEALR